MTDSLARTLRRFGEPALVERCLPLLTALDLDGLAQGAMFMTEQGAGSDVAGTSTRAEPGPDGTWALHGDKWFCSNPDAGFAMVLARSEPAGERDGLKGVSLFLLPRTRPDGTPNAYRILRLKDKLGTRSMASGEIRLEGATAWLVGERGRGFQQMADMVNNSRLSNGVRAAGLMRRALTEALHVARNRRAFGRRLVRILTPLIKFRACRDARVVTGDAMEVRGGCGYIEEWSDARLLRDAHLGSIWEGTSNIVALDVLRAIRRDDALPALRAHVDGLLADGEPVPAESAALQHATIDRAFGLAGDAARGDAAELARQSASALYHVVTMAGLRWEARRAGLPQRAALADLVLRHRLAPRDPLAAPQQAPDARLDAMLDGH
jgi:alkylation response protein AidB-like acyl-CoA dehydrogenase